MSWFNASQLSSFAKQALSQAQKSIDRVLDIQEEEPGAWAEPVPYGEPGKGQGRAQAPRRLCEASVPGSPYFPAGTHLRAVPELVRAHSRGGVQPHARGPGCRSQITGTGFAGLVPARSRTGLRASRSRLAARSVRPGAGAWVRSASDGPGWRAVATSASCLVARGVLLWLSRLQTSSAS